jgi:competence protein ComEA
MDTLDLTREGPEMRTPGYNKKQEHRAGNALIWAKEHRRTVAKAVVICLILLLSFAVHFTNRNEEIIQTDEPGSLTDSGTESRFADASEPDALQESNNVPIYVDISGAVHHPGVYEVSRQTRLFELIEKAGGLKETADIDRINQAAFLADGDKISQLL